MNWAFNQNCQLVISDLPNKGAYAHTLEMIVDPDGTKMLYKDRSESIVEHVKDGLYNYYLLLTNLNPDTIDINKISLHDNSIGDWTETEKIFSICNLRKCVIELEKKSIEDFLYKRCEKSSQQSTKDLLLISIFVLEHLINQEKYSEAERILTSLGSCENLCGDVITKTCNCNG